MKVFLLFFAITTTVVALHQITTTKAKIDDVAYWSTKLQDAPENYENPWTDDRNNGSCNKGEQPYFTEVDTKTYSQCMPRNYGQCPTPSNFDKGNVSGYPVDWKDSSYCVVECSEPGATCLEGSTCLTAPKELANDLVKNICLFQKSAYEQPAFDKAGKECQTYEHYSSIKHIGLTYGSCLSPKVNGSCPSAPQGFKNKPQESADGCELPCKLQTDCSDGTVCIPKPSQELFGTQLQSITFPGVCKYPDGHHSFNSPYEIDPYSAGCKETAADGVDIVEMTVAGGTKASICAPKAFADGFCPVDDQPDGYFKTPGPIAFKDTTGTHCQLSCKANSDCVKGSKCLTTDSKQKFCLYDNPVFYELPNYDDNPDKPCFKYEEYAKTQYQNLTYGACYPIVAKAATCPNAPDGSKPAQQGDASTVKEKFRCELPCNTDKDCVNTTCVPKSSPKLFGTQLQSVTFTGVCLLLDPESRHSFGTPYGTDPKKPECKKAGEEPVIFIKTDKLEAGICTTKPQDGKCPAVDIPEGYKKTPAAIPDADGKVSHCELPCDKDADCLGRMCLKQDGKDTKICLWQLPQAPHDYENPFTDKTPDGKCKDDELLIQGKAGAMTVGGCFYKLPSQYSTCPTLTDTSITATGKAYKLGEVTYCQASCATDANCTSAKNKGKCLAVPDQTPKVGKPQLADDAQLYCLYEKTGKPGPGPGPDPPGPDPPGPKPGPKSNHHNWQNPIVADPKKKDAKPTCTEGTEYVEFDTTESTVKLPLKAVTCAPKAQGKTCPDDDYPKGYIGTPIAVLDADGIATHCELPCGGDVFCVNSECMSVKTTSKKLFAMKSDGDKYLCLHKKALLVSQQFVLVTLILSFLVM